MLNRRILRIKVLQVIYAHLTKADQSIEAAYKELQKGTKKTHDLFFLLLLLLIEVSHKAEEIIEIRRNKITANDSERYPNTRFPENRIIKMIAEDETFIKQLKDKRLNWRKHKEVVNLITKELLNSKDYESYLNDAPDSFENDKKFVNHFFNTILFNTKHLYNSLEEQDIYWNTDIDFIIKKISVFIGHITENKPELISFPPIFKNDDDRTFARDLLVKSIINHKKYEEISEKHIVNWDIERVTKTDRLILLLAISEVISFETIPIKVTINEAIEMSKLYSSPKNAKFVNGVLDKIVSYLKENEMFKKTGRGLME